MKKLLALLSTLVMVLSLCACGGSAENIGSDLNGTKWAYSEPFEFGMSGNTKPGQYTGKIDLGYMNYQYEFYDSLKSDSGKARYSSGLNTLELEDYGTFTVDTEKQVIRYSSDKRTTELSYLLADGHVSSLTEINSDGSTGNTFYRVNE